MHTASLPDPRSLRVVRMRRHWPERPKPDPEREIPRALAALPWLSELPAGRRIAVAVGSRGIAQLPELVRLIVERLRLAGQLPFLVPAMGSHGGATPSGQRTLLEDLGVRAADLEVPLDDRLETVVLGRTESGADVHCAQAVVEADGVILLNRIKPHTDFGGAIGSGLLKMAVVGLGKHAGATAFHRAAHRVGYETALRTMARVVSQRVPRLGGVALLEDERHETVRIEGATGAALEATENRLAAEAAQLMPALPADDIDLLVVDQMGKNISGTGMDPNIIGRQIHGYSLVERAEAPPPRVRRLFVRDLTPESHGNATGIGLADFTTDRLVRALDAGATYTNALTALSLQGSKIPIHYARDVEVLAAALFSLGLAAVAEARVVRIRDTLSLETFEVSERLAEELAARPGFERLQAAAPWRFDAAGNLAP